MPKNTAIPVVFTLKVREMFSKTIIGASLALLSLAAAASDYYVVIPVKGAKAAITACNLPWGGTLPVGQFYDGTLYSQAVVDEPASCASVTVSQSCKADGTLTVPDAVTTCNVQDPQKDKVTVLLHLDNNSVNAATGSALTSTAVTYSAQTKKFGDYAALFNGTSSRLVFSPVNIGTQDFTVEGWAYANALTNARVLFASSNVWATSGGTAWWIGSADTGDASRFQIGIRPYKGAYSAGGVIPLNSWFHWAVTRQSGTIRGFLNGAQVFSMVDSSDMSAPSTATYSVVGNQNLTNQGWSGYLDEVRLTIGTARYTSNFAVPAAAHPNP